MFVSFCLFVGTAMQAIDLRNSHPQLPLERWEGWRGEGRMRPSYLLLPTPIPYRLGTREESVSRIQLKGEGWSSNQKTRWKHSSQLLRRDSDRRNQTKSMTKRGAAPSHHQVGTKIKYSPINIYSIPKL